MNKKNWTPPRLELNAAEANEVVSACTDRYGALCTLGTLVSGLLGGWQIKDKESNETVAGGYELVVGSGHRNEEMFWTEDKDAFGAGSLTSGAIWGSSQDNKDVIYWKDEENKIHATTGSYETEHNWS